MVMCIFFGAFIRRGEKGIIETRNLIYLAKTYANAAEFMLNQKLILL